MVKYAVYFVLFISSLFGAYLLGRSHSELKIVKEQIEVVKYVNKETAKIHAQPNASREQLLDLMKKICYKFISTRVAPEKRKAYRLC